MTSNFYSVIAKLQHDMSASPVDDVTVVDKSQLDILATGPSSTDPYAAITVDRLGCEHMSRDVKLIEGVAARGSEGPTEVVYLFAGSPPPKAREGWENEEKLTAEQAWTILCETPDITSPEEYPDHALITMEQLGSFMDRAIPVGTITCPCTTFEQDEYCPVGFPSLICSACDGKGVATLDQVAALAAEMMKVAEQVDELKDPFAAWESIDLFNTHHNQMQKALCKIADMADAEDADLDDAISIAVAALPVQVDQPDTTPNHVNGGAYRKISVEEWRDLGGDDNQFCDWHEGIGYVVYDDLALEQFKAKTSSRAALSSTAKEG